MNTAPESDLLAPSPKRRVILASLGAGLAAAVVGALRWPQGAAAQPSAATPTGKTRPGPTTESIPATDQVVQDPLVPSQLSREWFLPHLNTPFQVADYASLQLTEISPVTLLNNGAVSYNAFTLSFEAPADCNTPEGIHRLSHAVLGEMDLFISPVGRPGDRICYMAAFTLKS